MKWGLLNPTSFMVLLLSYVYIIVGEYVQGGMNLMKVNNLCRQFIVRDVVSVHHCLHLFIYKSSSMHIANTSAMVISWM